MPYEMNIRRPSLLQAACLHNYVPYTKDLLAECRVIDLAHGNGFAAHRSCDDLPVLFFSPKQFL